MIEHIEDLDKLHSVINGMAWELYRIMGYEAKRSCDFYEATHPQEQMMLQMAKASFEHFFETGYESFEEELEEKMYEETEQTGKGAKE